MSARKHRKVVTAAALVFVLATGGCGGSSAVRSTAQSTAPTTQSGSSILGRVLLRPAQVGPGYVLHQCPDGHGVAGLVTLDLCGFTFPSEGLRTDRIQVNYAVPGVPVAVSNEIVSYRPGGAEQALRELNHAIDRCPRGPVGSTIQGSRQSRIV
jgi:hypothetical protein